MEPHVGQRIAAPFLSVPAEVKTFEPQWPIEVKDARQLISRFAQ